MVLAEIRDVPPAIHCCFPFSIFQGNQRRENLLRSPQYCEKETRTDKNNQAYFKWKYCICQVRDVPLNGIYNDLSYPCFNADIGSFPSFMISVEIFFIRPMNVFNKLLQIEGKKGKTLNENIFNHSLS